jgi:uncharacterized protein YkwD
LNPFLAYLALALVPAEPADAASLRADVLLLVNAERGERGAPALAADPALEKAAQALAAQIAGAESLSAVESESGQDLLHRAAAAGYGPLAVAEIVLTGEGELEERLQALARRDPETFAEAMSQQYRDVGVGIAVSDERIVWVLLFGLKASEDFAARTAALSNLLEIRREMLERVNEERRKLRLSPLHENALLDKAAQSHAEDMIRRSYYSHETPEKSTVRDRVRKLGYPSIAVGENIAEGQSTVAQVMDAWMESPEHREHIVSMTLKEIGVGVAFGKNDRGLEIVWVQVFGTARPGDTLRRR